METWMLFLVQLYPFLANIFALSKPTTKTTKHY
jgi:hypothetical protein